MAASHHSSLTLNPSGVRLVLAQPAPGTASGLVAVVAAVAFLACPLLALLPGGGLCHVSLCPSTCPVLVPEGRRGRGWLLLGCFCQLSSN